MFIEIPASKKSISSRKLAYGLGINDADYMVSLKLDGHRTLCPFHQRWIRMLCRCYSSKYHERQPTYKGCTTCDEWLIFSNFKRWMMSQKWEGLELDKDIIKPGNRIYSPENCAFVTKDLNALLTSRSAKRGAFPRGVFWKKKNKKYVAQISYCGDRLHIGIYHTAELASKAYVEAKTKIILEAASEQPNPRIANGLRLHAEQLNKRNIN